MSTVNDEPLSGIGDGRKLYAQADKMLRFAERLQEKCEQYERGVTVIKIGATLHIAVLCLIIYLLWRNYQGESVLLWIVAATILFFSYLGLHLYLWYEKAMRHLVRERRAQFGVVDMLRGIERGIAEENDLSTLEQVEFRIRLARFDIGPGRDSK